MNRLFLLAVLAFVVLVVFTVIRVLAAIDGALVACDTGAWTFDTGKQLFHAMCWCFGSGISLWVLWAWGCVLWFRRQQ